MWVYALTLSARVDAGVLASDWEANHNTTSSLGVSVGNHDAVITCTPRSPQFADFVDEVDYVASIEEYKELPDPNTAAWSPPYEAHPNGTIEFVE